LPLNDAAYALWSRKLKLDSSERPPPVLQGQPSRLAEPKFFAQLMNRVMATRRFEADNAEYGSTFPRLKSAHPGVCDEDLRKAIRLAAKLEQTCHKNFSYSHPSVWEDVRSAIEKATKENPDFMFLEATYKDLQHRMCIAFR
jgi:hypothetical protein